MILVGIGLVVGTSIGVMAGRWITSGKMKDILKKQSLE